MGEHRADQVQPAHARERIKVQRLVLLNLYPPQHTKLRAIVSRGFTPKAVNSLREALTGKADEIVRWATPVTVFQCTAKADTIDLIFNAIADRMPGIRKLEEPRRLRSGWLNGTKEMRVGYS